VGEKVQEGELLFEVATDKAVVEHHSIDAGYLRAILIEKGEEALVNQAVAILTETADEDMSSYQPEGVVPEVHASESSADESEKEEQATREPEPVGTFVQRHIL